MNPLHLLWIVPLSAFSGVMFLALLIAGRDDDD